MRTSLLALLIILRSLVAWTYVPLEEKYRVFTYVSGRSTCVGFGFVIPSKKFSERRLLAGKGRKKRQMFISL